MQERNKGWDGNVYRGVIVYAMVEKIDYHYVYPTEQSSQDWDLGEVAEYDMEQQLWGWNIFDKVGVKIEKTVEVKELPTLKDVEEYIDSVLDKEDK